MHGSGLALPLKALKLMVKDLCRPRCGGGDRPFPRLTNERRLGNGKFPLSKCICVCQDLAALASGKRKDMTHVLIATPTAGGVVKALYATTLLKTVIAVKDAGWGVDFVTVDSSYISRARNYFAIYFCASRTLPI
jgi:hypothetical protein